MVKTRRLGLALVLAACSCSSSGTTTDSSDVTESSTVSAGVTSSSGSGTGTQDSSVAMVRIFPLDIWARPLLDPVLTVEVDGEPVNPAGFQGILEVPLKKAATIHVELAAVDHRPLELSFVFDGSKSSTGFALSSEPPSESALALSHREEGGLMHHDVHLGLAHDWFSSQARPPRRGNLIELNTSGETAWAAVRTDIEAAQSSVLISTWWWQSDFELTRSLEPLTEAQRWNNTMLGVLEKSPATKRVLVGQFLAQDGLFSSLTWDNDLTFYGPIKGDAFEVMGQANPTKGKFWFEPTPVDFTARVRDAVAGASDGDFDDFPAIPSVVPSRAVDLTEWPIEVDVNHASYHQKFAVIDGVRAHVGGMNVKEVDWDTDDHLVFEPMRMGFDASAAQRLAVAQKKALPENRPRKDYMLRIEGPAAQDVADVFQRRWQHQLDSDVTFASASTPFEVDRDIPEVPGGLEVQITTTMPQPFWEHGIAESWMKAIARAENYIFIEDQYFRAPMLNDVIEKRMVEKPGLLLVVVTQPVNEWTDPGCAWTYKSHTLFASKFPGRYLTLQLRGFDVAVNDGIFVVDETDAHFVDFYVHSKMLIVDDRFMSIGSANKNNRGVVYEAEMNAVVIDPDWVRLQRRRILEQMLPKGTFVSDGAQGWFGQLASAAEDNAKVYQLWDDAGFDLNLNGAPLPSQYEPHGFLYPLEFGSLADCFFESVGPDQTSKSH